MTILRSTRKTLLHILFLLAVYFANFADHSYSAILHYSSCVIALTKYPIKIHAWKCTKTE